MTEDMKNYMDTFDFGSLNESHASTVREGIETDKMEFKSIKDFCGQTIKVDGFFFTNGDYGKQVVVVGNGYKINMPKRCVETFEKIKENPKLLKALLDGHLALTNLRMQNTKTGTTTIFEYKNI